MSTKSVKCRRTSLAAFTLVELLVVIGIIALLVSILLPSLNQARLSAMAIKSMSNLRQLGVGLDLYKNDYRGFYPRHSSIAGETTGARRRSPARGGRTTSSPTCRSRRCTGVRC